MSKYLGLAVILCGFQVTSSFYYFDSSYREPRSLTGRTGQQPLLGYFNSYNSYPSLTASYLQAQRDLLNSKRRKYRHPGLQNDKPIDKIPEVIPDPVHIEPHIDHHEPIPKAEPQPHIPIVQPTEPLDTDPECVQGCEANIAPEKCHCAAHLCDTVSCTGGNACRLVTVGGLVEGACLPIDSTTGVATGQTVDTHSIIGCGLSLNQGTPCGRGQTQRFYFDLNTQSCLPFQYYGCGGNENNYDSVKTCETTCQSQHIAPGIIDHHNSHHGSHPTVSHGHAHPDHIIPVGTHGHAHPEHIEPVGTHGHAHPDHIPVVDHHEPVPNAEHQPHSPVVQPTEPLDTDPECVQGCEANIAPEKCHCAAHLCDTMSCTGGNACRLVTVGGLVEGTCLPIDSKTGIVSGQTVDTHSIIGCGLSQNQGTPCGRGQTQRFYFDLNTQSCLPFQYYGCGGNENNYDSVKTCETTCQSQHIAPGIIDHHNSHHGSHPTVSHGHAHPDHIIPVGTHGHAHPDHIEPVGTHGHIEPGHIEPVGTHGHIEPGHIEPVGTHGHIEPGHIEPGGTHGHIEPGHIEPVGTHGHIEPGHIEPVGTHGHIEPGHIEPVGTHGHEQHGACGQPKDRGRCGRFRRFGNTGTRMYYFDLERQRCIRFIYSGCGGNANRFMTKQACEETCMETRSSPGIIDHHNDPSLDPGLILGQPTHHNPTEVNQARGINQHHTGRILSPLIPGRIAVISRQVPRDPGNADRVGENRYSNTNSGSRTLISGMDIRQILGQLLSRRSGSATLGLTALNRPRSYGRRYRRRRRILGTKRIAKTSNA